MLDRCVRLIHATPMRRRYRIESATAIDWQRLEEELSPLQKREPLSFRLNRSCQSAVFSVSDAAAQQLLEEAWATLCNAVELAGASPPEPAVLHVRVQVVRPSPVAWLRRLAAPLNIVSLSVALALLLLALLLALIGILGMMLPLAPGAPLLLLAYVLIETAFALRRPFVNPVTAA